MGGGAPLRSGTRLDHISRSRRAGLIHLGVGVTSLALLALASATPPAESEPDVDRLLKRMDELYASSGTRSQIEISIVKPQKTRILRVRAWTKGEDKALMIIDAPARDAGTATLKPSKVVTKAR